MFDSRVSLTCQGRPNSSCSGGRGQLADGRAAINFAGWLDTPDLPSIDTRESGNMRVHCAL